MPKLLRTLQAEAQVRRDLRSKRSPQQQLKLLDQRPGGAVRERARLNDQLVIKAAEKTKLVTHDDESPAPKKTKRAKKA